MRGWWLKSIPVVLLGWAIPPIVVRIPTYYANPGFALAMFIGLALLGQLPGFWWRREGRHAIGTLLVCFAGPILIFSPFFMSADSLEQAAAFLILGALLVVVAPISALLIYFLVKPKPEAD